MNETFEKYGIQWKKGTLPLQVEMLMYKKGGRFQKKDGQWVGEGAPFHFKEGIKLVWPELVWHKWIDLFVDNWLTHRTMAVLGPAASGKTYNAAVVNLYDYFCFPTGTTTVVCSTTREMLEQRIWGEIKGLHRRALSRYDWLPGHMIEGRQRLVTDDRDEDTDDSGRDFRNGIVGVACQKGQSYVGIGNFAGVHNTRVRLAGDELSLLPRAFVDAVSNMDKCPDFHCVGLGNPKDTTDALGVLAEPAPDLGGWEGGIDQSPITKTWKTRRPNGIALQFVGTDSPNLDGKLGAPIITQEQIDRDISFYGKESLWFTMMDQGMMPKGQGVKRVLTRQTCVKGGAMNEPVWLNGARTKMAALDASYRAVGGDRCVLVFGEFGNESTPPDLARSVGDGLINQPPSAQTTKQIIALTETLIVPITNKVKDEPEEQIARFVMAKCQDRGVPPENFFYDAGMRTSLVQSFSRIWSNQSNSIDFGGKPTKDPVSYDIDIPADEYYSKRVTQLWFQVRMVIEAAQMRGLTEEMMMEFCAREWGMVGQNKIEVEIKSKMKAKTGRSPDLADAWVALLHGAIKRGFVIRRLGQSVERFQRDDAWKRDLKKKAETFRKSGSLIYS